MENENLKPIEKLTPFTKMIMTIGTLPSSFYASMSYYESMVWLYEYLKNQVIPTVDNNAEAVEELQTAFTTLETFISEYFDNLDVQEEINNKLDEMAEDGTLTNLIKDYVDPIYESYETEINQDINDFKSTVNDSISNQNDEITSFKSEVNLAINTIDNKVDSVASGSPAGVYSTVSALTTADPDHSKIYVVSADGHWYYYDGDSWEDGGSYQSSVIDPDDPNLIDMTRGYAYIPESSLDSSNNDANNLLNNRYYLYYVNSRISNIPDDLTKGGTSFYAFIIESKSYTYNNTNKIQILYDLNNNVRYSRAKLGNTWKSWRKDLIKGETLTFNNFITGSNVTDTTKDLNNAPINSITTYYLYGNQFAHAPIDMTSGSFFFLDCLTFGYNTSSQVQLCIDHGTNYMYLRTCTSNTWTEWEKINYQNDIIEIQNNIDLLNNDVYLKTTIQEPLDITNKEITFAGDSITAGNFIGTTNVWAKWLCDKLETTYSNKAVGGACFASVSGHGQIIDQINNTTLKPVLFIQGGINDYVNSVSKTDFTTALNNLCSWLSTNYNGDVIFVTPLNNIMTNVENTIPLNWYREEITSIALENGYSVIAGNEIGFPNKTGSLATLMFYDTVHPSVTGQKIFANKVYEILK